ncbi:MAG: hypothetical protein QGF59_08565 [Pirellulaceae bacterium]|nr:hypothetical protein [Pirellulaceae bacterium]
MNRAAGDLIDNVHWNRGRLVGYLYLAELKEIVECHRRGGN